MSDDVVAVHGTGADISDHLEQLRYLLHAGRMRAALEYLSLFSPYRFAAMYRIADDTLHNLVLVDRDQPGASLAPAVPSGLSYCSIVRTTGQSFLLEDAERDPRVTAHPSRNVVRAYCGVPLLDVNGAAIGSICLFDYAPVAEHPAMLDLLQAVSTALDPDAMLDAVAAGFDQRLDALGAMVELIVSSMPDGAGAREGFDSYANPLLATARMRLTGARLAAFEARLDEMSDACSAR